jgi:predicted DNA-binding protein with PD1-like motif
MMFREFQINRICQGSLEKGADILEGLFGVMKQHHIPAGIISGIGAVTEARLAFYNAETRTYEEKAFPEPLEIVSLKGNISIKDDAVFPHIHAVLSRRDFTAVGGHLLPRTYVFAFEFEIIPFVGEPFVRKFDEETGLFLWKE